MKSSTVGTLGSSTQSTFYIIQFDKASIFDICHIFLNREPLHLYGLQHMHEVVQSESAILKITPAMCYSWGLLIHEVYTYFENLENPVEHL